MSCPNCKEGVSGQHIGEYVTCGSCGVRHWADFPTAKQLELFYSAGHYRRATQNGQTLPTADTILDSKCRAELLWLAVYQDEFKSHLDVGAYTGEFVRLTKMAGLESWGVEIDPYARELAMKTVVAIPEDLPDRKFDLITMSHVLEHVHCPIDFLKGYREYLGNTLMIVVPNGGHEDDFRHTYAFDVDSLRATMDLAGFENANVELQEDGEIWAITQEAT